MMLHRNSWAKESLLRSLLASAVLTLGVLGANDASAAFDRERAGEAGVVGASVLGSLLYTPAKVAYAGVGSIVGGFAWAFSGGDQNVAKPILDRAWRGDYFLTPNHLRAPASIAFVGTPDDPGTDAEDFVPGYVDALPAVSSEPPACILTTFPVVYFASASSSLEPQARQTLNSVSETMKICPSLRFEISAYTDKTGDDETNRSLASRRADSVQSFLREQGVDGDRLSVFSYGEVDANNETREGRARNRRVELVAR